MNRNSWLEEEIKNILALMERIVLIWLGGRTWSRPIRDVEAAAWLMEG